MKSLLHCFWCGPSFPYQLRQFVKSWVQHLRKSKSEFEIVVWLTKDSLQAAQQYLSSGLGNSLDQKNWSKPIPNTEVLFFRASLGFNKFYIARPESLFTSVPHQLYDLFKEFHSKKRYTSASNICRLLIVNACGGIYTDVDYLLPDEAKTFPHDITQIMQVFNMRNSKGFYMSSVDLTNQILVENQCVIVDPSRIGSLADLFIRMSEFIDRFHRQISLEVENNLEYLANPKTVALNKSMFTNPPHAHLMRAFKEKDYEAYIDICDEIFESEHFKGPVPTLGTKMVQLNAPLLSKGSRHQGYHFTGLSTYTLASMFFQETLKGSIKNYHTKNWLPFTQFFDNEGIADQFEYFDRKGNRQGMYSWANPGYARLNAMSKVVGKLKSKYMERHNRVHKQPLIALITAASNEGFGFLESRTERQALLTDLERELHSQHNNALPIGLIIAYFKNFIRVVINKKGNITSNKMSEVVLGHLNSPHYRTLKNLIDPEKQQLTFEDLVAFTA